MPEEAASPVEPENTPTQTPATDDSDTGTPSPEPTEGSPAPDEKVDWEKRYSDLQPEYTRTAQENAQYRQLFELAQQGDPEALEILRIEQAKQDTEDDEYVPPEEKLAKELQEVKDYLAQQEQAQTEAQQEQQLEEAAQNFYESEFTRLDPKNEWDDNYRGIVVREADGHLDNDGLPDLDAAHKALQAHFEAEFKKRVASKRSPQAPSGVSGKQDIDLDETEARQEWMTRQALGSISQDV